MQHAGDLPSEQYRDGGNDIVQEFYRRCLLKKKTKVITTISCGILFSLLRYVRK